MTTHWFSSLVCWKFVATKTLGIQARRVLQLFDGMMLDEVWLRWRLRSWSQFYKRLAEEYGDIRLYDLCEDEEHFVEARLGQHLFIFRWMRYMNDPLNNCIGCHYEMSQLSGPWRWCHLWRAQLWASRMVASTVPSPSRGRNCLCNLPRIRKL